MYTLSIQQKSIVKQWVVFTTIIGLIVSSMLFGFFAKPQKANAYNLMSSEMGLGSRGADVSALQSFLASNGIVYPQGLVTGYFGPLTANAVMQFQIAYNIPAVGRVGPITLAKINSLISSGQTLDVSAPVISNLLLSSATSQSVHLAWQTNENSRAKVFYNTSPITASEATMAQTEPVLSGTVWSDTSLSSSKEVTLSSLSSHTTYYYVVEVIDAQGNVTLSSQQTFQTL